MSRARVSPSARTLAPLALALFTASCQRTGEPAPQSSRAPTPQAASATSPESASYRIAGGVVALGDGKHDEPAGPGSAARNTTFIWGTPLAADLDGDGDLDAVVIIANEPGGSGTFYYLAAAELDGRTYTGSSGVLLGDRIAPQGVTFANGVVTVDFAERRPGEPMSTPPSVGVSRRFVYRDGELGPLGADDDAAATRP